MKCKSYLFLVSILIFFQGCNVIEHSDGFDNIKNSKVEKVRTWFNESRVFSKPNSRINEMIVMNPNWKEFKIHKLEDGREVVEVLNTKNKDIFRSVGSKEDKFKMIQNSILFFPVANDDYEIYSLLTIQNQNSSSKETLDELNYLQTSEDFNGERIFFDSDNKFLGGWAYKDGKVSRTIRQSSDRNSSNKRVDGTIYFTCEYETITWWQEQAGPDLYLGTDYTISCEFTYVEDENYPTGPPIGGGGSLPGDGGPNPPEEEEHCYELHPTIPNLWVLCGYLIAENCFEGMPCFDWGVKFGNCTEMGNIHGGAVTFEQFEDYYNGVDYEDIVTDNPDLSISGFGSQPGGPLTSYRYVIDPLNPNLIIDMRHMLVIGRYGRAVGESVEILQWLSSEESAFDSQDFFSNELGYSFFKQFGGAIHSTPEYTTDFLRQFIYDASKRNDITTPEQCDWY
ncbi:hypothetical protein PBT90_01240 [Algoriphagus halophytocola]|uniref:Uncharacterized protein n=1 Tax=Algoriphagus halophytocola TaxID=2991499 RepID=A0ABY6ME89_9BACT|nr:MULTISPECIES: hypothetical protein [unclassified Algoriphagus]UZD22082.1 hypothetical protein OM944_15565 [Algoriphagus sp. TR-M5]WBL43333.1 hypothetical protein PBT90_01240 [Algoriphagus sp. TR-M9]